MGELLATHQMSILQYLPKDNHMHMKSQTQLVFVYVSELTQSLISSESCENTEAVM